MKFIALFLPACVSLIIRHRRNEKLRWSIPESLLEYTVLVIVNVLLAQSFVVYILGVGKVDITAFQSFSFFTKYMMIAVFFAWMLPYIEEIGCKYISISFSVDSRERSEMVAEKEHACKNDEEKK